MIFGKRHRSKLVMRQQENWVFGSNLCNLQNPNTTICILQEGRKKSIQKCERKLENRLLERLQQLEIAIDKLIAEADRLMNMEWNEMLVPVRPT